MLQSRESGDAADLMPVGEEVLWRPGGTGGVGCCEVVSLRGGDQEVPCLWGWQSSQGLLELAAQEVGEPLVIPPGARGEIELFKQLTWHYVIHDPALATLQEGQAVIVRRLYKRLLTWLADAEKGDEIYRIPQRLRDMYAVTEREPGRATYGGNKSRRQARAVADYIASLTETQAVDLYERLTGAGGHSVLDPWLTY